MKIGGEFILDIGQRLSTSRPAPDNHGWSPSPCRLLRFPPNTHSKENAQHLSLDSPLTAACSLIGRLVSCSETEDQGFTLRASCVRLQPRAAENDNQHGFAALAVRMFRVCS